MATEQCHRPVETTFHEASGKTHVHKETVHDAEAESVSKSHDMTKSQPHGVHLQKHAAQGMATMTSHGKKEKEKKEKKEKKEPKEKKEKKEKKSEHKKKPEKEKTKHKKGKDDDSSSSSDSD